MEWADLYFSSFAVSPGGGRELALLSLTLPSSIGTGTSVTSMEIITASLLSNLVKGLHTGCGNPVGYWTAYLHCPFLPWLASVCFEHHLRLRTVCQMSPGCVKQWKGVHSLPCTDCTSPLPCQCRNQFLAALRPHLVSEESFQDSSYSHCVACLQNFICPIPRYPGVLCCWGL